MVLSHTQCKSRRIICKLHFNATSENLSLCNPGHTVLMRFYLHICFHGNCMKSLRGLLGAIVGSHFFFFNGGKMVSGKQKLKDYSKTRLFYMLIIWHQVSQSIVVNEIIRRAIHKIYITSCHEQVLLFRNYFIYIFVLSFSYTSNFPLASPQIW